jgi:hypothetical protein
VVHGHPDARAVGGVIAMTGYSIPDTPGAGLLAEQGDIWQPVQFPELDDATVRLIAGSLLIGGEPGSGKSVRLNLAAATCPTPDPAAVSDGAGK